MAVGLTIAASFWACSEEDRLDQLEIRGQFEPASLDFGEVPIGLAPSLPVALRNTGDVNLTINDIIVPSGFVVVDAKTAVIGRTVAQGSTIEFDVTFVPSEESVREGELAVVSGETEIPLSLRGEGVLRAFANLRVDPSSIAFGTVELESESTRQVVLTNTGNADAVVEPATDGDPEVFRVAGQVPFTVPAGQGVLVDIAFRPDRLGDFEDTMRFVTGLSVAELQLSGASTRQAGAVQCAPLTVDFGQVARDDVGRQTVTCTAVGGAARLVRVRVQGDAGADFGLPMPIGTFDLAPDQSTSFEVEFRPTGLPGRREDRLLVEFSSARGVERLALALLGEVVPPAPSNNAMTLVLRWDSRTDVDLHLVRPDGRLFSQVSDCHFRALSPDWGVEGVTIDNPFLDQDNRTGFGPETINFRQATPGVYEVWAHFFSGRFNERVQARVDVYLSGALVGTFENRISCQDAWLVGLVDWDGTTGSFSPQSLVTRIIGEGNCRI